MGSRSLYLTALSSGLLLIGGGWPNCASAQVDSAPVEDDLTGLTGPLIIGGAYVGDIDFRVSPEGDGVVDRARLLDLLKPVASVELLETLAAVEPEAEYISFEQASVGGMEVIFDPGELGVTVSLPGSARLRSTLRFSGFIAPDPENFDQPAELAGGVQLFLSDVINHGIDQVGDNLALRAEGFVTLGGFDGLTLSSALDYRRNAIDRYAVEGVTLTYDDFDRALRFQAGSVLPVPIALQSSLEIFGVGVSRRYNEIRPFQNIRPSGRQSVILERRSTVEFYVNGLLVETRTLEPGPFDFDDLPLLRGNNDVRIVVRDGAGNEQVIDRSAFYSPVLLAPGITDFGGWVGVPEDPSVRQSGGLPIGSFYFLRGVEQGTLGATLQVAADGAQIGATGTLGLPFGFVNADIAYGSGSGGRGFAAAIDSELNFSVRDQDDLRFRFRVQAQQPRFADPLRLNADNPERWAGFASTTWRLDDKTSFSLGGAYSSGRGERPDTWTANLGASRSIGRFRLNLFASHREVTGRAPETGLRIGLSLPIGSSARASARYDTLNERAEVELSRFRITRGRDWDGRVLVARDGETTDVSARGTYYGQRVLASASHDTAFLRRGLPNTQTSTVGLSTFVGFADGRVGWGREGIEGFTLIRRHPSLSGMPIVLKQGSEEIFKSDGLGSAVVPVFRRYQRMAQEVLIEDLPPGYSLPQVTWDLLPAFASGYLHTVGSGANLSIMGRLVLNDAPVSLAIGLLLPEDDAMQPIEFFTSDDGSFFAEGLAPGTYDVILQDVPAGSLKVGKAEAGSIVELGDIVLEGTDR
ncbi:hypothetical protein E3U23_08725 [Erythrobacter litoralis]|uniref:hypothetical protein n=1 Tax=Erythrobacter litoralis TaxID=39960 RepID=UPI002434BB3E|nr:hypothetical protein [Erythrobacter litoralis]MDG6079276.1 hypothetical protein [Erythrobacter litoralis]